MGWMIAIVTLAGKIYYITRVKTGSQLVGDKMLDWGTCPREAGSPGPRSISPGERERNAVIPNRVGVNMLQFCSVFNSLSHPNLSNKVRGIFFLRTVSLVFIVSSLWLCMYMCLYSWSWQYNNISQLWVKEYHYCSSWRIDMALNNLQKLIFH